MLNTYDIRAQLGLPLTSFAFGDVPPSPNERDAQERVAELQRGNAFLGAWRHDVVLERVIAREPSCNR